MSNFSNIIGDDDWLVEKVPDVPFWNETMAIMTSDPKSGITSNMYIGRWWGKPTTLRQMIVFCLPGDRALFARNFAPLRDGRLPSASGLILEPLGDGRIRGTYDGPMELRKQSEVAANGMGTGPLVRATFEFTFSSDMPIWDLHGTDPHEEEQDVMFPGGHMEQLGKINGTLTFDGETHLIVDGPAVRDHSRGVRNFSTHQSHIWFNGQFPSGWGFFSFRASIVGQPGYAMNSAAVVRDGKIYAATIETDGLPEPGSDMWKPFDIRLIPQGLDPIDIRVEKLWNCYQLGMYEPADLYFGVPTCTPDPKAAWSNEQSARYVCNGEVGFGHAERCNRALIVDDHWRSMMTPENLALR